MSTSTQIVTSQVIPDQIKFLTSRPWWKSTHAELNAKLTAKYPATHLVATPSDDIFVYVFLNKALNFIEPNANQIILTPMEPSHCHDNVQNLKRKKLITEAQTGYALSDDGLWRCHSWGRNNKDQIVETTEARLVYCTIETPTTS